MMCSMQSFAVVFALLTPRMVADCIETNDASCDLYPHDVFVPQPTSASLLQKDLRHIGKNAAPREDVGPAGMRDLTIAQAREHEGPNGIQRVTMSGENSDDRVCSGVQAQGRCWFLSELGESCGTTCRKRGRNFAFVLPNPKHPVTPELVKHMPKMKNKTWLATECYVPSEDHYHTADETAARNFDISIGNWSHENCKLACPCGGAKTTSMTEEQDKTSESPGDVSTDHAGNHSGEHFIDISEHDSGRHSSNTSDDYSGDRCQWTPSDDCVKQFEADGILNVGCVGPDHNGDKWCSLTDPYHGSWHYCAYTCSSLVLEGRKDKNEPMPGQKKKELAPWGEESRVAVKPPSSDELELSDEPLCKWQPKPECAKAFEYQGVVYTGCIELGAQLGAWCSLESVYDGTWDKCSKVCVQPAAPVPQASVQRAPVRPVQRAPRPPAYPENSVNPVNPAIDPCQRQPQTLNDATGNRVTLDEVGFKIVAFANSPSNMKRFICRLVAGVGCRVMDLSALMAFASYYSRPVGETQQTFKQLETDLVTLCNAPGNWLLSQPTPDIL